MPPKQRETTYFPASNALFATSQKECTKVQKQPIAGVRTPAVHYRVKGLTSNQKTPSWPVSHHRQPLREWTAALRPMPPLPRLWSTIWPAPSRPSSRFCGLYRARRPLADARIGIISWPVTATLAPDPVLQPVDGDLQRHDLAAAKSKHRISLPDDPLVREGFPRHLDYSGPLKGRCTGAANSLILALLCRR